VVSHFHDGHLWQFSAFAQSTDCFISKIVQVQILYAGRKLATAKALLAGGMLPREVAVELGISVPTLYRWIPAGAIELKAGVVS
jgi:hypothetical protein